MTRPPPGRTATSGVQISDPRRTADVILHVDHKESLDDEDK